MEIFEPLRLREYSIKPEPETVLRDELIDKEMGGFNNRFGDGFKKRGVLTDKEREYIKRKSEIEKTPKGFVNIFKENRNMLIIGAPGSGKSTLLKWLAVLYAEGRRQIWTHLQQTEPLFPIIVSIGFLYSIREKQGGALSPVEALSIYCKDIGHGEIGRYLEKKLNDGKCLILLDGLDELITFEDRVKAAGYIENFIERYSNNRFIVTSRISAFHESFFRLKVYELLPFEWNQVENFTEKWCIKYEAFIREDEEIAEREGKIEAERLITALARSEKLKDLSSNPLLLSLIAICQRGGYFLPKYRIELYQMIAQTLIETWDWIRTLGPKLAASQRVDYRKEASDILLPLALNMQENHPGRHYAY